MSLFVDDVLTRTDSKRSTKGVQLSTAEYNIDTIIGNSLSEDTLSEGEGVEVEGFAFS